MTRLKVNVSVADDHLKSFTDVVDHLANAGLHVEQTHDVIGVVSGTVDDAKLSRLERVEGVLSVEADRVVSVPPPGSKVQ